MNHLGTWLKSRFRFNTSGVEPNTCVSNKLQWTLMLQICKPYLSSRILVSSSSQTWSTFYLKVSLWLVIYQENYIGQKTQNLFTEWILSCTQVFTDFHCPDCGSFFQPRYAFSFLLSWMTNPGSAPPALSDATLPTTQTSEAKVPAKHLLKYRFLGTSPEILIH